MRDIEQRIADWRREMSKTSPSRRGLVDEMEEHLREEIERSISAGVPADKAFDAAASKLGEPSAVAAEFTKLAASPGWLPVKIARIGVLAVAALLLCAVLFLAQEKGILIAAHVFLVGLGYLIMFIIGGLGICYICARWFAEPGLGQRYSLLRTTFQFAAAAAILTAAGVFLGMLWAKANWGRYWAWDPRETGGFVIFWWAVVISLVRWLKPTEIAVAILAICGSVITACGWFGTNGLSLHPLVIAFVVAQVIFILAGVIHLLLQSREEQAPS